MTQVVILSSSSASTLNREANEALSRIDLEKGVVKDIQFNMHHTGSSYVTPQYSIMIKYEPYG